ncbi:MAG: flagellar protein FlaG [Treponema sp.]|nr:flagellar protein FlaG [Treponema sp.]MCL2236826.1 flagellar protein FlaG [Treponema sp.]
MSVASVGYAPVSPSPLPAEFRPQAIRQTAQSEPKVKPHVIQNTAADIQRLGSALNKKLQFEVDHRSNEVIVKVIDKDTDKVIREIPPEELQRLHRSLKEVIGLLFDEMA